MIEIKILDKNFVPDMSVSKYQIPSDIKWKFIGSMEEIDETDIVFITDLYFGQEIGIKCRRKIAWILEPPAINKEIYEYISKNYKNFDYVITHNKGLVKLDTNIIKYSPNGMCWIEKKDFAIYKKTRFCSIIASGKNFTIGHKLRNQIIKEMRNRPIDVYGYIYRPIEYKLEGLKNHRFQIVVENSQEDDYFTEKLIDCFVTGTVPIYWGCKGIWKYFDLDGMIVFDTLEELKDIMNHLKPIEYDKRMNAIKNNFNKAQEYVVPEDILYKNYQQIIMD